MANEILYMELDEVNKVLFIEKGKVDWGFEINRKVKYVFRRFRCTVGCFEVFFDKRCYFFVRSKV